MTPLAANARYSRRRPVRQRQWGGIALGRPLGMSRARIIMSAVQQLEAKRKSVLSLPCVWVLGQGVAIALERV